MIVRGVDATYYTVHDIDGLTTFYTNVLGLNPATIVPGRITEWTFKDGGSFGLFRSGRKPPHPYGSVMFAVDDLDAALETCKRLGVSLRNGDGAVTETQGCRMAFALDPEGNQFILHQRH